MQDDIPFPSDDTARLLCFVARHQPSLHLHEKMHECSCVACDEFKCTLAPKTTTSHPLVDANATAVGSNYSRLCLSTKQIHLESFAPFSCQCFSHQMDAWTQFVLKMAVSTAVLTLSCNRAMSSWMFELAFALAAHEEQATMTAQEQRRTSRSRCHRSQRNQLP